VGQSPAGILQRAGSLAWLIVLNSGHLVPMCQPEAALEMVRQLLDGRLFAKAGADGGGACES